MKELSELSAPARALRFSFKGELKSLVNSFPEMLELSLSDNLDLTSLDLDSFDDESFEDIESSSLA